MSEPSPVGNPPPSAPDRNLALELVRVTEAAALGAGRWVGRGDKESADQAAVDAMRLMLSTVSMDGIVVIGEGEKDEAPMLYNGERVGNAQPPEVVAIVDQFRALLVVSGPQASLHRASQALQGRRRDHPLRGPPDPVQEVDRALLT